ncbi:cdp-alcohol phosphatidyltransferase [Diplodia corticola]|uniref:Cdp-alcohol phosphatidyltransferase n=1 Tax=Diplodia corticola TaxID=236234 RepID=A0A1J9QWM7_9PEZI|nr:cdp-alcohol phosphatidyltransferase [Diplodia corticola]OJD32824.1 cdp-alcohol phosphatidyltransferase [Diplodia corticola]
MRSTASTIAVLFAVVGLSSTQTIDPDSVSIENRNQWCLAQKSQCPLICLQTNTDATTESNTCDTSTLAYSCVCADGLSPNISQYSQTMPYFICTENNNRCVTACSSGDNQCASDCRTKNLCGAQNPTRVNTTTTASTSTASATSSSTSGGSDYSSFGDGNSGDSSSSGSGSSGAGALALDLGAKYGLAMVVSGLVGGAAILL